MQVEVLTAQLGLDGLEKTLAGLKETDKQVQALRESFRGLTKDALEAKAAMEGFGISDSALAKQRALNDEMRKTRDLALEIRAASGGGGGVGGVGRGVSNLARDAENQFRRDSSSGGLLAGLFGSQEAKKIAESGHGGGANGIDRGALFGLLPGGARPSQAALTTLLGLAVAGGPAVLPGALAAAPILGAGAGSLVGALGTLKLAFTGITAAAFTTKTAFDALSPAQQQFVQTLRSLDAGLGGTLKQIAQTTLLPQLSGALHTALSGAAVGSLTKGVGGFSNAIGGGAQQFAGLFGSSGFQDQFGKMLQQDAGYLRTFLGALTPLTDAFVRFQVAAFPLLHWLGQLTTQFSLWVDQSVKADAANGRLAEFFNILKTSLQVTGNLLLSVGHLAGAFVDALGFQNSVGVVKLLTATINDLAGLLKSNSKVFNDFFAGAIGAAKTALDLLNGILQTLHPILAGLDRLIGGAHGFKVAIEVTAIAWVVFQTQFIRGAIEMGIALIEAFPELAIISAILLIATHWKQFTTSMVLLFRAAWAGIKGILDEMVYFFLLEFKRIVNGITKAFDWLPIIGGELDKVNSEFSRWVDGFAQNGQKQFANAGSLAGQAWGAAFSSAVAGVPGISGPVGTPNTSGGPAGIVGPLGHQSLALPPSINYMLKAAAAGHGSLTKANAAAYSFYENLLNSGNLTRAQRLQVFGDEAQYAPPGASPAFTNPPAFGSTGTGFTVPNSYLLALAKAGADTKSTRPQIQALRSVIGYLNQTIPGLSPANQTTAYGDLSGYESQLSGLLGTGSSTSGVGFLPAGLRARLTSAQNATAGISGSTTPTSTTIRALGGLYTQLNAAVTDLTKQINANTFTGKQLQAAQAEQTTLVKQRAAAAQQLLNERTNLSVEHLLGIAGGAQTGRTAAASATSNLRTFLNDTLHRFGLTQTGSGSLGPFVQELRKNGDINQRQYVSLEKILKSIDDIKKINGTVASGITGNISNRLAEIKSELQTSTGFGNAYVKDTIDKGVSGKTFERQSASLSNRGLIPRGGAALGVPYMVFHIHESRDPKATAREVHNILAAQARRNTTQYTGASAGTNQGLG